MIFYQTKLTIAEKEQLKRRSGPKKELTINQNNDNLLKGSGDLNYTRN